MIGTCQRGSVTPTVSFIAPAMAARLELFVPSRLLDGDKTACLNKTTGIWEVSADGDAADGKEEADPEWRRVALELATDAASESGECFSVAEVWEAVLKVCGETKESCDGVLRERGGSGTTLRDAAKTLPSGAQVEVLLPGRRDIAGDSLHIRVSRDRYNEVKAEVEGVVEGEGGAQCWTLRMLRGTRVRMVGLPEFTGLHLAVFLSEHDDESPPKRIMLDRKEVALDTSLLSCGVVDGQEIHVIGGGKINIYDATAGKTEDDTALKA